MMLEKVKYKRIKIPCTERGDLIKICGHLPYNAQIELGGYITPSGIYFTEGTSDNVPVFGNHKTVFHTHPIKDRGDIPSELDILNLLFMDWKTSILFTQNRLIILSKTAATMKVIDEIDKTHEKHAVDMATLLKKEGPKSVFYYLVKKFVKNHVIRNNISHRTWPDKWQSFITDCLKVNIRTLDCIPLSKAA
jgi:hypothetical protein